MGTKKVRELTGTAVAKPGDITGQLQAYELANLRLHNAANTLGVFIGPVTFQPVVHANGRAGGHDIIIVTAPILETGTDEKVDHTTERDTTDER
jgi:hypothetical protein